MIGCASVDYTRIYSVDGVIIDNVNITLNKDVVSSDAKAQQIYDVIQQDVLNFEHSINAWVKDNFNGVYVGTDSVEKYFSDGIGVDISIMTETDNSYTFYFTIHYDSLQHFIYFYGLNTEEVIEMYSLNDLGDVSPFMADDFGPFISQIIEGNYDIENVNMFITDYVWSKDNAYSIFTTMERSEGESYLDYYINQANNILGEDYASDTVLDNVNVTESYETTEDRYDSNGTVGINASTGYYVHEWKIEDINQEIIFNRHRPQQVAWYVLAIVISLAVVVALLFVYRKKKEV
jgi:hypothetical protein